MSTEMRFGESLINGMFNSRSRISVNDASLTISQESRLDHRPTPTLPNGVPSNTMALSELAKFKEFAFGISEKTEIIKECLKKVEGFQKQSRNTETLRKNACKNIDVLKQQVIVSRTTSSHKLRMQFETLKSEYEKKQNEVKKLQNQMESLENIGIKFQRDIKKISNENVRLEAELVMENMLAEVQKNLEIQNVMRQNLTLNCQIQYLTGEISKSKEEQESLLDKTRSLQQKLRISESSQLRSRSGSMFASFDGGLPLGPSELEISDMVNNFVFYIENIKSKLNESNSFYKHDYSRQSISKKQDASNRNLQSNLQTYTKIIELMKKISLSKLSNSVLIDISNYPNHIPIPPPSSLQNIKQSNISKQTKLLETQNRNLKQLIKALKSQLLLKLQEPVVVQITEQEEKEKDYQQRYKKSKISNQQLTSQLKQLQIKEKKLFYELDKERKERRKLHNDIEDMKGNIRVYCRMKPFNDKVSSRLPYKTNSSTDILYILPNKHCKFDAIFGESTSQEEIFEDTRRLVKSAIDGYNVCIFAYGQTGSGKTFTLIGDSERPGVSIRSIEQIFSIKKEKKEFMKIDIKMSLLQIYLDNIRDLLSEKKQIRNNIVEKNGLTYVQNCTEITGISVQQVLGDYRKSLKYRVSNSTSMNDISSRSHLVLQFLIETENNATSEKRISKFSIIDLAGSQSIKTKSQLQLEESRSINSSLFALRNVITGLNNKDQHIKYRDNKLTHLLKDSLGGKAKMLMFVNLSSDESQINETISSLQFAEVVKSVEKKPLEKSSLEISRRSMSSFGGKLSY